MVSLYHWGVYDLYRYQRYNDVRLVFAPEFSVAQGGGRFHHSELPPLL
jgi:Peptidase S46